MATDGVALGSLGLTGEGWFDGYGLMQAFRTKARSLGADFVTGEVVGLDVTGGRVTSVRLGDGLGHRGRARRRCRGAVVARDRGHGGRATPRRGAAPMRVRLRCAQAAVPDCPLVIDTSGIWFRPEGEAFITAVSPQPEDDHDGLPLTVDHALFDERIWPALAERVPGFDAIRRRNAWAGYYEYSTFDRNAFIGAAPRADEPALRHRASAVTGSSTRRRSAGPSPNSSSTARYTTLDLGVFAYERLVEGRRVIERNVIG